MYELEEEKNPDDWTPMDIWDEHYPVWLPHDEPQVESPKLGGVWQPKTKGPVYNLPIELLSMTLVAAASMNWRAPGVHSLVCRLWREVLLNTPKAWAFMQIGKHNNLKRDFGLRFWIERAGKAPIRLHHCDNAELLPSLGNLHSLNYCGSWFDLTKVILTDLRILSLVQNKRPHIIDCAMDDLLIAAPRLQTLDLHEYNPIYIVTPNTIIHPTIRNLHIHLDDRSSVGLIRLLSPILDTLCIQFGSRPLTLGDSLSTITLSRLTKLTVIKKERKRDISTRATRAQDISVDVQAALIDFLNRLITPKLQVLYERGLDCSGMDYTHRSTIEEYISESPPNGETGISLTLIPNIRILKLIMPLRIAQEYISGLAMYPEVVCPRLEHLEVYVRPRPNTEFLSALETIKARPSINTAIAPVLPLTYWARSERFILFPLECEDIA